MIIVLLKWVMFNFCVMQRILGFFIFLKYRVKIVYVGDFFCIKNYLFKGKIKEKFFQIFFLSNCLWEMNVIWGCRGQREENNVYKLFFIMYI